MKKQNTEQKNTKLSEIGLYNQGVDIYLKDRTLSPIEQMTIKLFTDNAQRNKLSNEDYNIEVEKFNNTHGFFLYKKGKTYEKNSPLSLTKISDYHYINYPYIDTEAFRMTMEAYRQYVHNYNLKTKDENEEIKKYNRTIKKDLTEHEAITIKEFKTTHKLEYTRVYNKLAEEFNLKHGAVYIAKKRIQTIKYQTEVIFSVLLGFYAKQLKTRNASFMEVNISTACNKSDMPKLKINYRSLANHKQDDIQRLDICKKTAQNHVKRLFEAGIFTDYKFINQYKPILVGFNTEILTVFDANLPKSLIPENQTTNKENEKVLHNKVITTGTFLKEKEIKDFAKCKADKLPPKTGNETQSEYFYRNTKAAVNALSTQGAGEPSNYVETLTNNFLAKYQDKELMAELLASNYYEKYTGLRYEYLQKIAMYGLVSTDDFRKVLIQDFIKTSAKIWKNHNVYVGEWKKTINYINETFFKGLVNKKTMIDKLREYRWKIDFARKWFIKKDFKALFPYDYFDTTRDKSYEVGFFGLHKYWKKHLEIQKTKQNDKQTAKYNANRRKSRISTQKKYEKAILKYHLGKMNYKTLYSYVQDNLPKEYLELLAKTINNNTF